jgi:hypothetical protein
VSETFFRRLWQRIFPAESIDPQAMAKRMFLDKSRVHNEQLAMSNAIQAALQHNPTYTPNASDENKNALRARWAQLLRNLSRQYNSPVDDGAHVQNIRGISEVLSSEFAAILQGRRFRIGTSQKSLNLYLKFLWCLGRLRVPPPHCPIDRFVLQKAKIDLAWTQMDSCEVYMQCVDRVRKFAGASNYGTLQVWELTLWNQ